jgi:hypothetical protein
MRSCDRAVLVHELAFLGAGDERSTRSQQPAHVSDRDDAVVRAITSPGAAQRGLAIYGSIRFPKLQEPDAVDRDVNGVVGGLRLVPGRVLLYKPYLVADVERRVDRADEDRRRAVEEIPGNQWLTATIADVTAVEGLCMLATTTIKTPAASEIRTAR